MRPIFAALVAVPLLAGCANTTLNEYEARVGTLVGVSETDLVRRVGVPTRSFESNGHKFLAYYQYWPDIEIYPVSMFGRRHFRTGAYGSAGLIDRSCETTFEVVEGKVAGFTHRGSACGWGDLPVIAPA